MSRRLLMVLTILTVAAPLYAQEPAAGDAASTVIAQWSIITAGFALAIAAAFGALGQSKRPRRRCRGHCAQPQRSGRNSRQPDPGSRADRVPGDLRAADLADSVLRRPVRRVAERRAGRAGQAGGAGRAGTVDAPDVPAFGSSIPPLLPITPSRTFPVQPLPPSRPAAVQPFLPFLPVPPFPPIPRCEHTTNHVHHADEAVGTRIWIVRPSFLDLPGSKQISLIYH